MNQGIQYDVDRVIAEAEATGRFVSFCTIQAHDGTLTVSGAPSPSGWANVTGYVNLPCIAAPIAAAEKKELGQETGIAMLHVILNGLCPAIETAMRAVLDGITYDILGVDNDSQKTMTTLDLRKAEL